MAEKFQLPAWIIGWSWLTAAICTWDASYILLRPYSMPGGMLNFFWRPYNLYIQVDQRYADMDDTFVYAVSLMNCVEVLCNLYSILLHAAGSKKTYLFTFTVAVMTWWKTVLYLLQYLPVCGGGEYSSQNSLFTSMLILWAPNVVWIVVPFLVMKSLWNKMMDSGNPGDKTK